MREIKFRGYSQSFDMMFDYDMLEMATAGMVDICRARLKQDHPEATEIKMGLFLPTDDKDLTLMQYTGLEDENGTEIYEGDIVTIENHKFQIVFEIGSFMFARVNIDTDMYELFEDCWNDDVYPLSQYCWNNDMSDYLCDVEVIGNIYKNYDLL